MIDFTTLPKTPGCYLFKDEHNNIIYVGKAKELKKRVSNYFTKKDHDAKTLALVSQIKDVDFIATNTDVEAYILENNLIKKNQPKYNINLKDSKRYAYLEITNETYPRLIISRTGHTDGGRLFGPFVSGTERNELMEFLIKTFQIRTCNKLPKKECLRYHLKLCTAPCINAITQQEYAKNVRFTEDILNGKTKNALLQLTNEMNAASKNKEYEKAISVRNIIDGLKQLNEKQNMERNKQYDEDIINYSIKNDVIYLLLFNVHQGMLENKQEFVFDNSSDFFEEFLIQYYSENTIPQEIIVPVDVDETLNTYFSDKKGSKVSVIMPQKGEKKQLLDLVAKNIELNFFADEQKLNKLKEALNLDKIPAIIECFDISHLAGTATVGSMIQYRNAKPNKDNYRRFKIKTVDGIDDFSSIAEVVRRRYLRIMTENGTMPDLIVIDGGKGQLSAAVAELQKLNLKLPIISIAKEFEEIYVPGASVSIPMENSALQLIRQIRDEAHRFAIGYNKQVRKKQMYE